MLYHVLHLLGLDFDGAKVLLGYDISIVLGLNTSLDHEVKLDLCRILIEDTDLIVATDEGSELVS